MERTNLVDDGALDALDTDRLLVNTQYTCTLAGCRAHSSGELRKVVGQEKAVQCIAPLILEHKIIPLRNDV